MFTPGIMASRHVGAGGLATLIDTNTVSTSSANPTVVAPDHESGDVIVLIMSSNASNQSYSWPSGFTQLQMRTNAQASNICGAAYKVAGASEPANYTVGATSALIGHILGAYSVRNGATPVSAGYGSAYRSSLFAPAVGFTSTPHVIGFGATVRDLGGTNQAAPGGFITDRQKVSSGRQILVGHQEYNNATQTGSWTWASSSPSSWITGCSVAVVTA